MTYDEVPPAANELEDLAAHFMYELRGFWWARQQLDHTAGLPDDDLDVVIARSSMAELLLLHLRNVTDFFLSKPIKDDVVAHHYLADWTEADGGDELEWLKERLFSINKRLAHLTAYRLRVDHSVDGYLASEVFDRVQTLWLRFFESLDEERRGWFLAAR